MQVTHGTWQKKKKRLRRPIRKADSYQIWHISSWLKYDLNLHRITIAQHNMHLYMHDFGTSLGFLFIEYSMEKKTTNKKIIYSLHGTIWIFLPSEYVCWYFVTCNLVMCINLIKWTEHFVLFYNTVQCKKETNMAVTRMTCKICLIWCHIITLYGKNKNNKKTSFVISDFHITKVILLCTTYSSPSHNIG